MIYDSLSTNIGASARPHSAGKKTHSCTPPHTHTNTHKHTHTQTHKHTNTHTHIYTYIRTYIHTRCQAHLLPASIGLTTTRSDSCGNTWSISRMCFDRTVLPSLIFKRSPKKDTPTAVMRFRTRKHPKSAVPAVFVRMCAMCIRVYASFTNAFLCMHTRCDSFCELCVYRIRTHVLVQPENTQVVYVVFNHFKHFVYAKRSVIVSILASHFCAFARVYVSM